MESVGSALDDPAQLVHLDSGRMHLCCGDHQLRRELEGSVLLKPLDAALTLLRAVLRRT